MKLRRNKLLISIMLILNFTLILKSEYQPEAYTNKKNIVILLDNSISMNESEKGIGYLAKVAGNMIIDSIKEEEANISIITFGTKVTVLKELKQDIKAEELKSLLNGVKFDEAGTNVKDALKDAIYKLNNIKGDKSVIILSDGQEEPVGGLTEKHKSQLNGLIDEASKSNIKVNTIALSNYVDRNFLSNIASNTGGVFREGQTADKLFQSLTTIIGAENNFTTIENYITSKYRNKEIFLSSMVKEIIINIAACDNKKPQARVILNNEVIEPLSYGDMYYVYRFNVNKDDTSKLNIIASGNETSNVIVQFKSDANIKVISDINKYISIPQNIPIDLKLSLVTGKDAAIEGTFIEVNDGRILKATEEIGVFNDCFEKNNIGENIIRYTARDKNNGIIAVNEVIIYRSNVPAFYYNEVKESILKGEKFKVEINKRDNKNVEELSGELVITKGTYSQQIPMSVNEQKLIVEEEINEIGEIKYCVNIRGKDKDTGELFAYSLPLNVLCVKEKPEIFIEHIKCEKDEIIQNKENKIVLKIDDRSFINEDTEISVLDSKNNIIGVFNIGKDEEGLIEININPKNKGKNLNLYFKTNNGIEITEHIETKLNVNSYLNNALKRYGKIFLCIVLPIIALIGSLLVVFIYLKKKYEDEIKDYTKQVYIYYYISPDGINGSISRILSNENSEFYLSFNNKKNIVEIDGSSSEQLTRVYLENINKDKSIVMQIILYLIKQSKIFVINYEEICECIEKDDRELEDSNIKKISFKVGKKIIDINFE